MVDETQEINDDVMPLRCRYDGLAIRMAIGQAVLESSAVNHPDLCDVETGGRLAIKIIDREAFAKEVVREVNREEEDGTTLLAKMLDQAILNAIENGCEGVEFDGITDDD